MVDHGAGQDEGGVFQDGFGLGLGIARATGGAIGQHGFLGDGVVTDLELGEIGAEIERGLVGSDGDVLFAVGDVDTGANHLHFVGES